MPPQGEARVTGPIPEPPGLPVVGHTVSYLRDPFEFITENARLGRIVRLRFPRQTVYQLNEPDDIEEVLVHRNEDFHKGSLVQRVLGSINEQGLLVTEGDVWRRQRHLVNPAFHPERIAEYTDSMTGMTERTVAEWATGSIRDVHADLMELTLEIVANALFGIDIREEATAIGEALEAIMARSENAFVDLVPQWAPTPANRRFSQAVADVERIVDDIIEARQTDPGTDVVSSLLASGEDDHRLSPVELRDQVMTLLLAGHETTALALTFSLFLIAQHPPVETRIRAELADVLDGRTPTIDDLPDLTYTENVVKEVMRLYPPVHTIPRESAVPVDLDGHSFPAGTTFTMHQWTVHRDARFFRDPLAFDPDRWAGDLESDLPRFAYFPFGGGPRRCVGDRFALVEARLVLASLLQAVHLELVSPPALDLAASITTRPKEPIRMVVHDADDFETP